MHTINSTRASWNSIFSPLLMVVLGPFYSSTGVLASISDDTVCNVKSLFVGCCLLHACFWCMHNKNISLLENVNNHVIVNKPVFLSTEFSFIVMHPSFVPFNSSL